MKIQENEKGEKKINKKCSYTEVCLIKSSDNKKSAMLKKSYSLPDGLEGEVTMLVRGQIPRTFMWWPWNTKQQGQRSATSLYLRRF